MTERSALLLLAVALAWYLLASLASVLVLGFDKLAAKRGWRRVPEKRLHLISLLGGWPGAWIAHNLWRHKRQKGSYLWRFWAVVTLHVVVWGVIVALLVTRG
ncbi:MAG: DUF1294 domain-containing protein [Planctomycetota bacterium]